MTISGSKLIPLLCAVILFAVYSLTAPQNHSEAEDVYDFALQVEQGSFADQAGVNRVLALPIFGYAYRMAQTVGYSGRAFPFMIYMNRLLAVACLMLFWKLISTSTPKPQHPHTPIQGNSYPPFSALRPLPFVLCLAFSYGFWRYANEAETYILASVFVLGAWCLALRGKVWWSVGVSVLGILIHLLNLIPLLLIIPLYYLLSKDWKKGLFHGGLTGLLVIAGYAICSPWLDLSELGAQHHAAEGGISLQNLLRGGIAFGQNVVSANFLFGFESFRDLLASLFPSRMLDEEFYMAQHMSGWIKWAGSITVVVLGFGFLALGVKLCRRVWMCGKAALECGGSPVRRSLGKGGTQLFYCHKKAQETRSRPLSSVLCPLSLSAIAWLLLYALAVIRTEAGSPELWIMALIPFWLLGGSLLTGFAWSRRDACDTGQGRRDACDTGDLPQASRLPGRIVILGLVLVLFAHNLIGGLLPVMSEKSDYHIQKSAWLLEHTTADDLVLTSYEPILIFYLNYYCPARLLNSSEVTAAQIQEELGNCEGNPYAFNSFFQPLKSMAVRSPDMYERMAKTGEQLLPMFGKIVEDEFGGIYRFKKESRY